MDFNTLLNANRRRHNLIADLGRAPFGRRERHQYGNNDQRS
jgi:hypothetical protein